MWRESTQNDEEPHFDREVAAGQGLGRIEPITDLNVPHVLKDFIIEKFEFVADAKLILGHSHRRRSGFVRISDSELCAVDLLTFEQACHGFNCGVLIVEIVFEM